MIDFDNPPTMAADYRGTIEVYPVELSTVDPYDESVTYETEWWWRCKAKNGQKLGYGEGYKRRAGALNAIEAQYAVRLTGPYRIELSTHVVPWRVVIHDRDGNIDKIGALY